MEHFQILQRDWFKNARTISLFVSTHGEVNTDPLIRHCLAEDKEVFIPRWVLLEHEFLI
jgi:5-formyltetrahydrofolate cyclo-ligase